MLDIASNKIFDAIILGAGASGVTCTIFACKKNKKVLVLDHNEQALKKVKISGGGNCNWSNADANSKHYLCSIPQFCDEVLKQFSPSDMMQMIKQHNIKFYEKTKGQYFCKEGSQKIIDMLLSQTKNAKFEYNTQIKNVKKDGDLFVVTTNKGIFHSKSLVIASGGMSYANLGASDLGYNLAKQFGHKIIPYAPALVPLNIAGYEALQGLSLDASVECNHFKTRDGLLFTHFGLSGPAILQTSLYWQKGFEVKINILPEVDLYQHLLEHKNNSKGKKISTILKNFLPNKLADFLSKDKDIFITEASNKQLKELADKVNNWKIIPSGTQGFRLAEASKGGVDVSEVNSQTMESKITPNLYIIGEVLDVTGKVGGFNLQWAWSSGKVCGTSL